MMEDKAMEKFLTVNWYYYIDFENEHTIEMEFINNITGAVGWKMYKGKTKKAVQAKAKREETRITNIFARIYS